MIVKTAKWEGWRSDQWLPEVKGGEGKEVGVSLSEYHRADLCGDGAILYLDCYANVHMWENSIEPDKYIIQMFN